MQSQFTNNSQLHTLIELRNFTVQARDGVIGQIADLRFATSDWVIRYLIIETGDWLADKQILIPVTRIEQIDWEGRTIDVSLTRVQFARSPTVGSTDTFDRSFEERFFDCYERPGYWIKESEVDQASWESFPASDPPAKW